MSIDIGGNSSTWKPTSDPIYPAATDYADSLANFPISFNSLTAPLVNCHARLLISVPVGTTFIDVWCGNTLLTGESNFDVKIGVYVDGVYSAEIDPITSSSTMKQLRVTLDGAAHTVALWTGYQQGVGTTTPAGTVIYAVQGTDISLIVEPTPDLKVGWYGDSISAGGAANPLNQNCSLALLRGISPDSFAMEAFGSRALWDDCGSGSGQQGFANQELLAQRMTGLVSGARRRIIWSAIGYNDIARSLWPDIPTFAAAYGVFLDDCISIDPGCEIVVQSPLHSNLDAGIAPWTAAVLGLAAARPTHCVGVDGFNLMAVSGLAGGDGIHPVNAGHQAWALGTGGSAGSSSMRAVLGI